MYRPRRCDEACKTIGLIHSPVCRCVMRHRKNRLAISQRSLDVRRRAGDGQQSGVSGEVTGNIMACDAKTGGKLWQYRMVSGGCAPADYLHDEAVISAGRGHRLSAGTHNDGRADQLSAPLLRYLHYQIMVTIRRLFVRSRKSGRLSQLGGFHAFQREQSWIRKAQAVAVEQYCGLDDDMCTKRCTGTVGGC